MKIFGKEVGLPAFFSRIRSALVLVMDVGILTACLVVIWLLQKSTGQGVPHLAWHFLLLEFCILLFQILFRTYKSLWMYAESKEYLTLAAASGLGYLSYLMIVACIPSLATYPPFSLSLLSVVLPTICMLLVRLAYRRYRTHVPRKVRSERTAVLVIGAGDAGVLLLNEMLNNPNGTRKIVCFVDDNPEKIGHQIHGVPVVGPIDKVGDWARKYNVREILIAIPSAGKERLREILNICTTLQCRVLMLPSILEMVGSRSDDPLLKQMREVKIDDLLGREPVNFENKDVYEFLSGRIVMVTGGGGSIGSELCRQIAKRRPKTLIIVDMYENNAYDIQQELKFSYGTALDLRVEIASVRDAHKINVLFERYHPEIVFHAAAHKHVPLMETCPEEAIRNNVFGTYHVAHAADTYHADRFILISTDKAVNPTNVMGASKRLCEMVVQGMAALSDTKFAAVRFGNVLGSNGSVIPLFQRQIRQGGPVTVTDKRIIRYFMTIPEAAQLVLQAGAMAQNSEIFVLDMGSPVSILELAENLIRLSGYTPYVDIAIEETGLRPGEKLYEELLMRSENLRGTTNHKIFIEQQKEPMTREDLENKLEDLRQALKTDSVSAIITTMQKLVPTYKSPEEVNARAVADLDYAKVYSKPTATPFLVK